MFRHLLSVDSTHTHRSCRNSGIALATRRALCLRDNTLVPPMSAANRHFELFLLRFVPNAVREEFINVGVLLHEISPDSKSRLVSSGFCGACFLEDLRIVQCLDKTADLRLIRSILDDIRQRVFEVSRKTKPLGFQTLIADLRSSSHGIVVTGPRGFLGMNPDDDIKALHDMYIAR